MRRPLLLVTLLLGCAGTASAGQIYKWVDAQGITHFTAQPPHSGQASVVPAASQPPAAATSTTPTGTQGNAAPTQEEIDARVRQEVAKKEKERLEYCTTLRTNLAQLRNNPRLRMEVQGETRRVTEEERQAKIHETEQAISQHCE